MSVRNYADVGENGQKIVQLMLANQNLLKLLYYNDRDPLGHPNLTEKQKQEVFEKYIRIVPRVGPKETANSLAVIKFGKFQPNYDNKEFKDVTINIEVIVPLDNWIIKSVNLRPFLIMGEIEKSLNGKSVNGLGRIVSYGASLNFLTDEISDYEMTFLVTSYD